MQIFFHQPSQQKEAKKSFQEDKFKNSMQTFQSTCYKLCTCSTVVLHQSLPPLFNNNCAHKKSRRFMFHCRHYNVHLYEVFTERENSKREKIAFNGNSILPLFVLRSIYIRSLSLLLASCNSKKTAIYCSTSLCFSLK